MLRINIFILKNTHWPHVSSACKLLPDVVCNLCLCSLYWGTVHWHYVSRGPVSYYLVLCVFCYLCVTSMLYVCMSTCIYTGEQSTGIVSRGLVSYYLVLCVIIFYFVKCV